MYPFRGRGDARAALTAVALTLVYVRAGAP